MRNEFEVLGIPIRADETRTSAICCSPEGESRIVIAARGYALIVHPQTGHCTQVHFPGGLQEYPFSCIGDKNGLFYTGAGKHLLVLDPFRETFIFSSIPAPEEEIAGLAFAVEADGSIWFTTYPGCYLIRYDPDQQTCSAAIRLDAVEKYAYSLATDDEGWVYAGIGTEHRQVTAYHISSNKLQYFVAEKDRTRGSGVVYKGRDGNVYGQYDERATDGSGIVWYQLHSGRDQQIPQPDESLFYYQGKGFQRIYMETVEEYQVISVSLEDRELILRDVPSGSLRVIGLTYESQGADLSPMALGPDGHIYGTSNHPLHFYAYVPSEERIVSYGGKAIERGGGGNICAYAVQGSHLTGAAYAGGYFHIYDTSKPLNLTEGSGRNPRLAAIHSEIHRPRGALAHPDGEHVIYGGFPGYGFVGGALGIYNVKTGDDVLIPNERLVPFQSTICLAALPSGDIAGGTSIMTPGGAKPKASEAEIYILDWKSKQVRSRQVPGAGISEISLMVTDRSGRLHCITSDSLYFVYDIESNEITDKKNLACYGTVVRDGMQIGPDGLIYLLLHHAILCVEPETLEILHVNKPGQEFPITSGMAIADGNLYFGSQTRLMRYALHTLR
jgi:hypothetical protein